MDLDRTQFVVRLTQSSVNYMNLATGAGAGLTIALTWGLAVFVLPERWGPTLAVAITALVTVAALFEMLVLNVRERRFLSLKISVDAVTLHRGRLIETDAAMLRSAMVSVDVASGPLLRRLGLAKITFNGIGRFPEVPPLTQAHAREVQSALTRDRRASDDLSKASSALSRGD